VGLTTVSVEMSTAYDSGVTSNATFVALHLEVRGWPWTNPRDVLAVQVPVWPSDPQAELLAAPAASPSELQSVTSSTGTPSEYLLWGATGSASSPGSPTTSVPVSSRVAFAPGLTTLTWVFGSGSGGASAVSFDSRVGVVLPSTLLGIPLYEYGLSAAAAGAVVIVAAVGLRQVRRRPSTWEYVKEEKP
jgi:hypothetical protein